MRAGQPCSIIHIENSFASGSRKRPRGPRSSPTEELTSKIHAALQRTPVDLNTHAITYYVRNHLQKVADVPCILRGICDDILLIWMAKSDCRILDLAISSMALAVFSQMRHDPPAALEASTNYQKLLQTTHVAISTLDEQNVEPCLLAIWFMSRYEDAIHRPSHRNLRLPFTTTLQSFSHHDGALAILKCWKDRLSHARPATDVIMHTRRNMIRSAVLRNLAIPDWMLEGTSFGEHGLNLVYDRIVVQIANVRQRFSMLLNKEHNPQLASCKDISKAEELNKEARMIDQALQNWTACMPNAWCYKQYTLSNTDLWPTRDFFSPTIYSYSSPTYAAVCNHYYATRMLINNTRLRIIELSHLDSGDSSHEQQFECLCNMNIMADKLASSIPYCLQRFSVTNGSTTSSENELITLTTNMDPKPYEASLAIWPLSIASSLGNLEVNQMSWFRSQLARLGRLTGTKMFECAETDHWLEI